MCSSSSAVQMPSLSRSIALGLGRISAANSTSLASGAFIRKITLSYLYSGEMMGLGKRRAMTPAVNCASLPVAGFVGWAFFIASADASGLKSRGRVLLRKYLAFIQV